MALSTTISPTSNKKLANFGPLTIKFSCLISTHPKSTFSKDPILTLSGCCALKFLRLMQLHSGCMTMPGAEFQIPKIVSPVKLMAPGGLTLGSDPNF